MPQLKIKDNGVWVDIPAGGVGVPSGGNEGDVLAKSSSVDYATEWTTLPPDYKVATIDGTWTATKNGGLAYVELGEHIPNGYVPISASLEITSGMSFGAFLHAFNPTRYYETNGSRNWMLRIQNANANDLTFTGTLYILCVKVST